MAQKGSRKGFAREGRLKYLAIPTAIPRQVPIINLPQCTVEDSISISKRICSGKSDWHAAHANDGAKTNPTSLVSSIHGTVEDSIRALQPKGRWHAAPSQRQLHHKPQIVGCPPLKRSFYTKIYCKKIDRDTVPCQRQALPNVPKTIGAPQNGHRAPKRQGRK